jgi:hypothetical protein
MDEMAERSNRQEFRSCEMTDASKAWDRVRSVRFLVDKPKAIRGTLGAL